MRKATPSPKDWFGLYEPSAKGRSAVIHPNSKDQTTRSKYPGLEVLTHSLVSRHTPCYCAMQQSIFPRIPFLLLAHTGHPRSARQLLEKTHLRVVAPWPTHKNRKKRKPSTPGIAEIHNLDICHIFGGVSPSSRHFDF